MSKLIVDADLDMGIHNITLDPTYTVDGEDLSVKLANRAYKIFVPMGPAENCIQTSKGGFETQNLNAANSRIHGICIVPPNYISGADLKMIYIDGGVAQACSVLCETPCDGENHLTGGSTGITSIPTVGVNNLEIVSMGFTLTDVHTDDVIGFYLSSHNVNNVYVIGFQFEYTGTR